MSVSSEIEAEECFSSMIGIVQVKMRHQTADRHRRIHHNTTRHLPVSAFQSLGLSALVKICS